MGTLLRYPYEVREETDYFEDIPNIKIDKEMLDLAKPIGAWLPGPPNDLNTMFAVNYKDGRTA
jgi:hypothetical protein